MLISDFLICFLRASCNLCQKKKKAIKQPFDDICYLFMTDDNYEVLLPIDYHNSKISPVTALQYFCTNLFQITQ